MSKVIQLGGYDGHLTIHSIEIKGYNTPEGKEKIGQLIAILLDEGYMCKVWTDGASNKTCCVEFDFKDESYKGRALEWIDENGRYIQDVNVIEKTVDE